MSRLISSGFGKPSPFEFPRYGLPPSPPETHRENISGAPPILSAPSFGAQDFFPVEAALASASPDLFAARANSRKGSSIPYHSSPIPRETHRSTGSRTKVLIMVLPPSTLLQEPGSSSQSHSVSSTPFHRLSQGVLLPLFPSLFSQLTAIAKEFNFPSTSGLVLYYHIVENGVSFTPRISEDSWQTIWAHLAEPQERPPLISGKIEFDIDLRIARWYSTWLSALRREVYEYTSTYHPSTAPSMAHFRGESRTTMADKTFNEDDSTEILQPPLRPLGSRHIPRKLSLVERLDLTTSKGAMSPPDSNSGKPRPLSTIAQEAQEDEPKTVKSDLVSRVKNWRASASIAPIPLIQPGLDPVNLPNDMEVPTEEEEAELRMSDFAWSVSSAGPPSTAEGSISSWIRVPSIQIAQRMAGSVATTESYHTSSGPSDYDPLSPISWSYPPSVHLANRLEGSVCSTASYRTSSGPSDYDPYSPLIASSHLPTPDIARRFFEDTPPTPQTCTSWGPPSWPPSPRCFSPAPSLDLGERLTFDGESMPSKHYPQSAEVKPWEHVWPYTKRSVPPPAISEDVAPPQPWTHMWPYTSYSEENERGNETKPWVHMWPYSSYQSNDDSVKPWSHAWPYYKSNAPSKSLVGNPLHSASSYPNLRIYAPVYPHLDIYPSVPGMLEENDMVNSSPLSRSLSVRVPVSYPVFDLYPAVYPYNLHDIYPNIQTSVERADAEGYPYFDLYPSKTTLINGHLSLHLTNPRGQYPHFEIYPSSGQGDNRGLLTPFLLSSTHEVCYPALNIYPAVYPYFDLYPSIAFPIKDVSAHIATSDTANAPGSGYPAFNLYPAIYPNFDLYPAPYYEAVQDRVVLKTRIHGQADYLWTAVSTASYPSFTLYPPVYPHFDLYPAPYFSQESKPIPLQSSKLVVTSGSRYPTFDIYPAVYPNFDLYPAVLTSPPSPSSPRLRVRPTSRLPVPVRGPPSPRPTRVKSTSRLTHSELHAMVMMEKFGSNLQPLTPPRRVEARHIPQRSFSDSVYGLPASPSSGIRRQASLADRRMSYMQNAEASSTSPAARRPSQRQSVFGARMRDSLVLQKVRAFDTNDHASSPGSVRESPSRLPRSFPPLPAVPVDHDAY